MSIIQDPYLSPLRKQGSRRVAGLLDSRFRGNDMGAVFNHHPIVLEALRIWSLEFQGFAAGWVLYLTAPARVNLMNGEIG